MERRGAGDNNQDQVNQPAPSGPNVAFHFLRPYLFLFRRISHGATRLQEVLADRAAARIYGAQPFEEGPDKDADIRKEISA